MRVLTLKVYFHDTPHPWTFENVTNMCTEGALLRITKNKVENEWYPLTGIFRIVEVSRKES